MYSLKSKKSKFILIMSVVILFFIFLFIYKNIEANKRNFDSVHENLSRLNEEIIDLTYEAKTFKHYYHNSNINKTHSKIVSLNTSLKTHLADENAKGILYDFELTNQLPIMVHKLYERKIGNYWDDLDEKVLKGYIDTLEKLEERILKGIENAKAHQDVSNDLIEINRLYEDLNSLSISYTIYSSLPDDLDILSDIDLIKIVSEIYGEQYTYHVESSLLSRQYTDGFGKVVYVSDDTFEINLVYDMVFGNLIALQLYEKEGYTTSNQSPLTTNINGIETIVYDYFDNDFDYLIEDISDTSSFSSDIPITSFQCIPYYDGFPIYYGNVKPELHFRSDDGYLTYITQYIPSRNQINATEIKDKPEVALNNFFASDKEWLIDTFGDSVALDMFTYKQTAYVYSFETGLYELQHIYQFMDTEQELFVSS